ncbi:hypothetical protein DM42_6511 [Burkholderia cepacia]|nr:hypothetical protein DM42_6511 [Burkholderia cepacia]
MSTKDKNSSLLDNAATNVRNEVAETAVAFLVDCRLTDRDLTAGIWEMALEYAYKPHPRFWRDIDLSAVVEAISLQYPNWRCAIATGGNAEEEVLHEVDLALFCNGFFEAMAEKMMELPKSARPRTGVAALQWICAELDRNGQVAELLSRGGVKEPGMGGVMAPAEPGVKRGFERFQGCGFLPFLATAF